MGPALHTGGGAFFVRLGAFDVAVKSRVFHAVPRLRRRHSPNHA